MLPHSQQHNGSIPVQEPAALSNVMHAIISKVRVFALCAFALFRCRTWGPVTRPTPPVQSSSQITCLPLRVVEDDIHGLQAHHGAVDAQRMLFIQRPRHICLHKMQESHASVRVKG